MKVIRHPDPPPMKSRSMMTFNEPRPASPPPSKAPKASNEVAAHAVRVASNPGGIDPRQMHN